MVFVREEKKRVSLKNGENVRGKERDLRARVTKIAET